MTKLDKSNQITLHEEKCYLNLKFLKPQILSYPSAEWVVFLLWCTNRRDESYPSWHSSRSPCCRPDRSPRSATGRCNRKREGSRQPNTRAWRCPDCRGPCFPLPPSCRLWSDPNSRTWGPENRKRLLISFQQYRDFEAIFRKIVIILILIFIKWNRCRFQSNHYMLKNTGLKVILTLKLESLQNYKDENENENNNENEIMGPKICRKSTIICFFILLKKPQ